MHVDERTHTHKKQDGASGVVGSTFKLSKVDVLGFFSRHLL